MAPNYVPIYNIVKLHKRSTKTSCGRKTSEPHPLVKRGMITGNNANPQLQKCYNHCAIIHHKPSTMDAHFASTTHQYQRTNDKTWHSVLLMPLAWFRYLRSHMRRSGDTRNMTWQFYPLGIRQATEILIDSPRTMNLFSCDRILIVQMSNQSGTKI